MTSVGYEKQESADHVTFICNFSALQAVCKNYFHTLDLLDYGHGQGRKERCQIDYVS